MKKTILFLISALLVVSCCGCKKHVSRTVKPKDLIPEDTFVNLVAEQLVFESALDYVKQGVERNDTILYTQVNDMICSERISADTMQLGSMHVMLKLANEQYATWMKQKGVTPQQYKSSLQYYFSSLESTQRVMTKVRDRITTFGPATPMPWEPYEDQPLPTNHATN